MGVWATAAKTVRMICLPPSLAIIIVLVTLQIRASLIASKAQNELRTCVSMRLCYRRHTAIQIHRLVEQQ